MSKKVTTIMIVISAVFILLGLAMIIWPETSQLAICYVIGALLLGYGIYRIVTYFVKNVQPAELQFGLAIGIFCAVLGIFLLLRAKTVVAILAVIVGIAVIVDSIFRIQTALNIRRLGGTHWMQLFIVALVVLALGMLLMFNPFTAVTTAIIIAGVTLVVDGILSIWSLIQTRRLTSTVEQPAPSRVK
jgi:uncharacterized membrane protein HdeD (DUF308 family)